MNIRNNFFLLILTASILAGLLITTVLFFRNNTQSYQTSILQTQKKALYVAPPETKVRISLGKHYSNFNKADFYDASFEGIANLSIKPRKDIQAIVVNHHLLAREMIAQIFSYVATDKKITVLLLSPNHFNRGQDILVSKYDWETPYGILEADLDMIDLLDERGVIKVNEDVFQEEHGISNLVAYIKKSLPNAKVIPMMVKESLSDERADKLSRALADAMRIDDLMIGSFDFSHYLPRWVADFHDEQSLTVLQNIDTEGAALLDIDSRAGLRVLMEFAHLQGAKNFTIVNHANSWQILRNDELMDTTSYITGFYSSDSSETMPKATILALGDLMVDRYVRKAIEKNGAFFPFENIHRFLSGSDIIEANLEGPITDFKPGKLHPNNTNFTFDSNLAPVLRTLGFSLFGLANNHTRDRGDEGLKQTRAYLNTSNIDFFGDPENKESYYVKEIRGIKVGFVGYSELRTSNFSDVISEIKKVRPLVDFLVVSPHWGIEYQYLKFSQNQQKKAHEFVDAGADLILGTHPHVIQPIEFYKNRLIFYSLGNFLFDQTFSKETQVGLGVGIVIDQDKSTFYLIPHETRDFKIDLLQYKERAFLLQKIAQRSVGSEDFKKAIADGKIINQ